MAPTRCSPASSASRWRAWLTRCRNDALALHALHALTSAEDLLYAGVALPALEVQWDEVFFVHQLLQEYFAARACRPATARAHGERVARRRDAVRPGRSARRSRRCRRTAGSAADRLGGNVRPRRCAGRRQRRLRPRAAGAQRAARRALRSAARSVDLAGAARHAAADAVRAQPRRQRRPARSLGEPRFERCKGAYGDYLLPLVTIPAGTYPIGSDEGIDPDEAPAHTLAVGEFAIARFPLTNAEWRMFLEAGGYDDERWWQSAGAVAREAPTE